MRSSLRLRNRRFTESRGCSALSLTVWIALTPLVAVVVYSTRSPAVIRALKWMPLPPIMRMCKRWTGLLLATATMALAGAAGAGVVSPTPLAMGGDQPVSGDHLPAAASPGRSTAFKVAAPVPLRAGGIRTDREVPEHAAATNIPPFRSFRPTVQGPDRSADTSRGRSLVHIRLPHEPAAVVHRPRSRSAHYGAM